MLKDRLLEDLKGAMKTQNKVRKNTIQSVRASILQEEKDKQRELTEQDIENIIMKEKKKGVDALEQIKKSKRKDLIQQTEREITILEEYLPKQLTEQELQKEIDKYFKPLLDVSIRDMGNIVKDLKLRFGNSVDGKLLAQKVKEKILK